MAAQQRFERGHQAAGGMDDFDRSGRGIASVHVGLAVRDRDDPLAAQVVLQRLS